MWWWLMLRPGRRGLFLEPGCDHSRQALEQLNRHTSTSYLDTSIVSYGAESE